MNHEIEAAKALQVIQAIILGCSVSILIFGYWLVRCLKETKESNRIKRKIEEYPKAFKPMKIGKVIDMKLDDFEDAISN